MVFTKKMNLLPSFYFSNVQFLHKNYVIFDFTYINNNIEETYKDNYFLTLYGNQYNYEKFYKIFDEINYCNLKNVPISCSIKSEHHKMTIYFDSCFAEHLQTNFLGDNVKLAFNVYNPTYHFAGAAAAGA